jgi:hypothetical protein
MSVRNTSVQNGSHNDRSRVITAPSASAARHVISTHPNNPIPSINTSRSPVTVTTAATRSIDIQSSASSPPSPACDAQALDLIFALILNRKRTPPRNIISIIPNEILLDIFEMVLSVNPGWLSARASPVRLSHVCVLWRALVLATPSLWVNIKITEGCYDPNKLDMTHFPSTLLRVEHYLERSRERPLIIDITLNTPLRDDWNTADAQKLAIVNPFLQTCVEKLSRLFVPHLGRFS